jgi:hypothetical protein
MVEGQARGGARVKGRKPSDDTGGVLAVCALFLAVRGVLLWTSTDHEGAWPFFVRAALLVPASTLIWRKWRPAVLLTMAGDVLDGLRVLVHAIDGGVLPSMMGMWFRMVLLWLLALAWRDLSAP